MLEHTVECHSSQSWRQRRGNRIEQRRYTLPLHTARGWRGVSHQFPISCFLTQEVSSAFPGAPWEIHRQLTFCNRSLCCLILLSQLSLQHSLASRCCQSCWENLMLLPPSVLLDPTPPERGSLMFPLIVQQAISCWHSDQLPGLEWMFHGT
jgi:hypothetical protein